jgi:flagellar motor switch protein FliG
LHKTIAVHKTKGPNKAAALVAAITEKTAAKLLSGISSLSLLSYS